MSRRTGDAHVVWMEFDGELYSPRTPLSRATLELIERDIWNGAYAGVCHAVYSYGSHANGGGYCREVTQDLAERLGRMSFTGRGAVAAPVRAFLEAMGVDYYEDRSSRRGEMSVEPFQMLAPPEPVPAARRGSPRRRSRSLSPEELRAQPQLKLPIAGGKTGEAVASPGKFLVEIERDEEAGIEVLTLKDTSSVAEQEASWDRLRAMVRSWEAAAGHGGNSPGGKDEAPERKSAKTGT